jgi:RNA 2',3'-cyclic 3'-phosphodiesterase
MSGVPEQLCFPGLDMRPTDRLFFSIFPDSAAVDRTRDIAAKLRGRHGLRSKPLAPDRWHVSLQFVGDYAAVPNDVVAKACDAAATIAETPFNITFDRAGSFAVSRRKVPLVLRSGHLITSLMALQRALVEAMARNGLARCLSAHYTPHMTLLYDARYVALHPVEPVEWTVREFVLIHSLLGKTRHVPLARWPLRAPVSI